MAMARSWAPINRRLPDASFRFTQTGLGAVSPAVAAGTPTPASPLSATVTPVTANIGGRTATVTFAGLAPGLIGVYQVNIIVPLATPSGTARLALYADGIGSQTAVTIQVAQAGPKSPDVQ